MTAGAPLVPAFLRKHRVAWTGLFVLAETASAVTTASVGLVLAADAGDGLSSSAATPRTVAEARIALESVQYVTGLIAGVCLFFTAFLVGSAVAAVVDGRRQELAMLRLAGASPGTVARLVLGEVTVVSLAGSVAGAGLGLLGLRPYGALLARLDLAPEGFAPAVRPECALVCVAGTGIVALLGAVGPARRVGRARPIEALGQGEPVRLRLGRWRVARGVLGAVGAVVLLALPASVGEVQAVTLLLAGACVVTLAAFSPAVIPGVARLVGAVATRVAPGAGLVAQENAAWDVRRTAALGNPVLLLVTLASALFMVAQTGQAVGFLAWQGEIRADLTASSVRTIEAGAAHTAPVVPDAKAVRYDSSDLWAWPDDEPGLPTVAWTDPAALGDLVDVRVVAGALADIGAERVATTDRSAQVGDTLMILGPEGEEVHLNVAAVLEPTAFVTADVLAADDALRVPGDVVESRWFVSAAPGADPASAAAAVRAALPGAEVQTVQEWIDSRIQSARASQTQGLTALIGGAGVLALCSVAQAVGTSLRERRKELRLLLLVGASRRSVVGTAVIEVAVVLAAAALLAAAASAAMYARMLTYLRYDGVDMVPSVPVGVLATVLLVTVVVATLSAVAGAVPRGRAVLG